MPSSAHPFFPSVRPFCGADSEEALKKLRRPRQREPPQLLQRFSIFAASGPRQSRSKSQARSTSSSNSNPGVAQETEPARKPLPSSKAGGRRKIRSREAESIGARKKSDRARLRSTRETTRR